VVGPVSGNWRHNNASREEVMRRRRFVTVTMGVLVIGGLLEAGYGRADTPAGAQGVPSELPGATQNRNKDLPAAQRFVILPTFTNDAVLDKATGLVWERSPQTTSAKWTEGRRICIEKHVAGQNGWRLPSLEELSGLVDSSVAPPGLALPPGHPFLAIRSAVYWSSTRPGEDPKGAWGVHFGLGGGATFINWAHSVQVWCVRDGMTADKP
jgi:hypothetical protein